ALGKIVFANEEKRQQLNAIIHPEIRKEIIRQRDEQVKLNAPCVVLDIPLLFESKLTDFVDKIMVVSVDPDTQLDRIMKRDDSSMREAKQRIASQIPVATKEKQADAIIDNSGTKTSSYEQLAHILENWDLNIH